MRTRVKEAGVRGPEDELMVCVGGSLSFSMHSPVGGVRAAR